MEKLLAFGGVSVTAPNPLEFNIVARPGKFIITRASDPCLGEHIEIDAAALKAADPALYDFALDNRAN